MSFALRFLEDFRVPVQPSYVEWAEANIEFPPSVSANEPGPFSTRRRPYMREIIEAFRDPGVTDIIMPWGAQLGKTTALQVGLACRIEHDPQPCLWVMSTDKLAKSWEKFREKGIDSETLLVALEDALLAAYRKTPGAVEWARVDIDRDTGEMQVNQLVLAEGAELVTLPRPEPEIPEGVDPEEFEPPPPDIDWSAYGPEQIQPVSVTTDNFGRIAAQTAKQVVLQRIREAEIAFPRHAIDDVNVMRRKAFGQHGADGLGHVFLSLFQPIG
jgi:hypothetical protein